MYTIGTKCKAQWTNGQWYPGTITQVAGDQFFITFDDGDTAWVQMHQIQAQGGAPMSKGGMGGGGFAVGTACTAQWTNGQWYPGTITQVSGDQYFIKFDDGDTAWVQMHQIQAKGGAPMSKGGMGGGMGGGGFAAGARIRRQWTDGNWYSGTITQVSGNDIHVKFDDGDEAWLATHEVQLEAGGGAMSKGGMGMGGMTKGDMGGMGMAKGGMGGGMYQPGQQVQAMWGTSWYGAVINQVGPDGRFHVTYEDGYQDWLTPDKIKPVGGMDMGMAKGGMDMGMAKGGMGMGMAKGGMFQPGQQVQAMWGTSWYGAVINQVGPDGRFHVTYEDGYQDWLTPDKIKPV